MANETAAEILKEIGSRPRASFRGEPWYNCAGDRVIWYFQDQDSYAERIDDKLTVYRTLESDEVVGCQIKGIQAILDKQGIFCVNYDDNTVLLSALFYVSHYDAKPDDDARPRKPFYDRLIEKAGRTRVVMPHNPADTVPV